MHEIEKRLRRQQALRARGHTVLTVLVGPEDAFSAWCAAEGLTSLRVAADATAEAMAEGLLQAVLEAPQAREWLLQGLAQRGIDTSGAPHWTQTELEAELNAGTCFSPCFAPLALYTHVLLRRDAATQPESYAQTFLRGHEAPHVAAAKALRDILPTPPPCMLILAAPARADAQAWLQAAPALAAEAAAAAPELPLALHLADEAAFAEAAAAAKPERVRVLLREGRITPETHAQAAAPAQGAFSRPPSPDANRRWLGSRAETGPLAADFDQLQRQVAGAATQPRQELARSAAEAFLFRVLESLPETRGRFHLNQRVDAAPGVYFEIDLLCAPRRIACEIDGYWHFRDEKAYRKDRRKDYYLQRSGYLVLRFLARDVVSHLEEIIERIIQSLDRPAAPGKAAKE